MAPLSLLFIHNVFMMLIYSWGAPAFSMTAESYAPEAKGVTNDLQKEYFLVNSFDYCVVVWADPVSYRHFDWSNRYLETSYTI